MKSMTTKILALTAALCGLHLSAATPVAVWDGDFTKTISGYTLDANGNTVAADGSTITIGSKGVKITFSEMSNGVTVMYKYSDLSTGKEQALATVKSSTKGNAVGVELTSGNKTKGIWEGSPWGDDGSSFTASSGTIAMTYKHDVGTYAYSVANGSRSQIYGSSSLKSSNYKPQGVNVGGMDSSLGAAGMKITGIAVFNSVLSESDMKSYVWPSELSKMYNNRLSTGNVVVPAGTYGAITVPGAGYKATAFTEATKLPMYGGSTEEVSGSYDIIIRKPSKDTDIYVHTFAGWFKIDALPTAAGADNVKTIYVVKSADDNYGGYKVAVGSDGKIYVGQCNDEGWRNDSPNSTVVTTEGKIEAGKWFHLAVAIPGRVSSRTTTAAIFFNGEKVETSGGPFGTNLNGNGCSYARIGTKGVTSGLGISAAGIYVDTRALYDGRAVVNAAKGFVVAAIPKYTATISGGTATWSSLSWEPTKPATFESNAELTINNTAATTLTLDQAASVAKISVVNASGNKLTIPYGGMSKLSATTFDFSKAAGGVEIDLAGITAGEQTLANWNITGGTVTFKNAPDGWGVQITADGLKMWRTETLSRKNPLTDEEITFTDAFTAGTSAAWEANANWRTLTDGFLTPIADTSIVPGMNRYNSLVFDGNLMGDVRNVTMNSGAVEGWYMRFAFLNGVHVAVPMINKIDAETSSTPMWFWVDSTSSFTADAFGTGTDWNKTPLKFYVAADEGLHFKCGYDREPTLWYNFGAAGSVVFDGAITAGGHTVKRIKLAVGETKTARHVVKRPLVKFASSSVTFTKSLEVTTDNTGVTATSKDSVPTANDPIGTYYAAQENDGFYIYFVQNSDEWDIVEPLSCTLNADTQWSAIKTWTDANNHEFNDVTGAHQYKIIGGSYKATLDAALATGSTIEVVSGTLEIADSTIMASVPDTTVDAGATLLVKTGGLVASKVTNSGTIRFEGGSSSEPIAYTADGDADANLGTWTLAADTYVKVTPNNNKVYKVTGEGASSCCAFTRNDGGIGFSEGSAFNDLTIVCAMPEKQKLWIERGIGENVRLDIASGEAHVSEAGYVPTFIALSGSGKLSRKYDTNAMTINCAEASNFSGTCDIPLTIGGSALQLITGNYTGALTVNSGATVGLKSASPSSLTAQSGAHLIIGANTSAAAIQVSTSQGVNLEGATIDIDTFGETAISEEKATYKLISANGGFSKDTMILGDSLTKGNWAVTVVGTELQAQKKTDSHYITIDPMTGEATHDTTSRLALDIDRTWIDEKCGTAGKSAEEVTAALNETAANGTKPWESYVLGLDPNVETSVPVIQPAQAASSNGAIAFQLSNVAVNAKAGADVTYKVVMGSTQGGSDLGESESASPDETISVDLPTSGVKYYKLQVDITNQ